MIAGRSASVLKSGCMLQSSLLTAPQVLAWPEPRMISRPRLTQCSQTLIDEQISRNLVMKTDRDASATIDGAVHRTPRLGRIAKRLRAPSSLHFAVAAGNLEKLIDGLPCDPAAASAKERPPA